ncbi:MAG: xanthine dehydrogenase family protein molybdopterin-binding subunit, partial [Nitrososphaerota archaeon]|nr:xanthine dehydrogenase family protein molybdopterin-binding subunit [Nitrososphaerota archaeon]
PHGFVRGIDTTKALSIPGVKAVITCLDDTTLWSVGEREHKRRVFTDHVRFIGDCIGAVAATSRRVAQEAVEAIEVQYEALPAVFSIKDAMRPEAPKIWDDGNVIGPLKYGFGNLSEAFNRGNLIIERDYSTSRVHNAPMETAVSLAWWDSSLEKLTLIASTQGVFNCRKAVADSLVLAEERVHVTCLYKGGGFGNKGNSLYYDLISALLAKKARKPVMTEFSREQDFVAVHGRWSSDQHLKAVVDTKQGRILAVDLDAFCDIGGYTRHVKQGSFVNGAEIYYSCEAWSAQVRGVYTNSPSTAHMRAPTGPQACFASETLADEIAHQLSYDPLEFRLRNSVSRYHGEKNFVSTSMNLCLRAGAETFGWKQKWRRPEGVMRDNGACSKLRGVGVAMANFHANLGSGDALLRLVRKGDLAVLQVCIGLVDIGTGAKSTMAIIAADVLGIPLENTRVIWGDTESCPIGPGESGSRATTVVGTAVRAAARRLKQTILSFVSERYRVPLEDIYIRGGKVSSKRPLISLSLAKVLELMGREEIEEREVKAPAAPENLPPRYAFAAHFCEVEVDIETGEIAVVGYTAAHESGEIINRLTARNQVRGAIVMGIGMALSERVLVDQNYGAMSNASFMKYKLPSNSMAPNIKVVFVRDRNDTLGPKPLGEIPLLPVPAAIGNALFNATGVRLRQTPFLPETLLGSLSS